MQPNKCMGEANSGKNNDNKELAKPKSENGGETNTNRPNIISGISNEESYFLKLKLVNKALIISNI